MSIREKVGGLGFGFVWVCFGLQFFVCFVVVLVFFNIKVLKKT